MSDSPIKNLIGSPVKVVNVGLDMFASDLKRQSIDVIQVDWKPPAGGDPKLAKLLSKLGT